MEEACVDIQVEDLEFVHADFLRDKYANYYFKAQKWVGEPTIGEPNLSSEAVWIDKDNLPDDVTPQLKNMFDHIKKGSYYSEIEETLA